MIQPGTADVPLPFEPPPPARPKRETEAFWRAVIYLRKKHGCDIRRGPGLRWHLLNGRRIDAAEIIRLAHMDGMPAAKPLAPKERLDLAAVLDDLQAPFNLSRMTETERAFVQTLVLRLETPSGARLSAADRRRLGAIREKCS